MSSREVIQAKGLGKSFGGVSVLRKIDLSLREGEVHAIVGENGAGKSTLSKLFGGVFPPSEGEIFFQGSAIKFANPKKALENGIALIHQEPLVFSNLSVAENVFVGNQPGRPAVDWKGMHAKAASLFASLGVKLDTKRDAGGLSVADQQMIELASALNHNSKVIIFDETTASLTPKEVADLFVVIRRLKEQGCALAIVTHRLDEVFEISDRISVLRDGDKVAEVITAETTQPEIIRHMVGRPFEITAASQDELTFGEPQLEVDGLSCAGFFSNISFKVRAGEIVGLAGLVGAGRTEVCETIFGVRKRSAGSVKFFGKQVDISSPRDAIQLGLAMAAEDRQHNGLILPFGISENISLASMGHISKASWLDRKAELAIADRETKKVGLKFHHLGQAVSELSGGNQQKVVLAKWLETNPKFLILDEPTRGVDIRAKDSIHQQVLELARSQGMGILMVSSDLSEVLQLSDTILVMRTGSIQARFSRAEATPEKVMTAAAGQVELAS